MGSRPGTPDGGGDRDGPERSSAEPAAHGGTGPGATGGAVRHNAAMSRAVYLHVGAPRTGTSYLHRRLAANRETLAQHGVHVPAGPGQHLAALDLLGRGDGRDDTDGQWDALVRATQRLDGTAVISQDALATARPEQVRRALGSFGGADVHVVYVARDLARQIPTEWQESLKRGRSWSYARYLDRVSRRRGQVSRHFWRAQDVGDVLSRWSAGLAPENVHVVVAPAGDPTLEQRWELYCAAFAIDPSWAPAEAEEVPPPLSIAEAGTLRALNRRLREDPDHDAAERRAVVRGALAGRRGAHADDGPGAPVHEPITLRPDLFAWAAGITEEWVDWITGSGVHVVGDINELWPPMPDPEAVWSDPDHSDRREMASAALDLLAQMTLQATRRVPADGPRGAFGRAARMLRRAG